MITGLYHHAWLYANFVKKQNKTKLFFKHVNIVTLQEFLYKYLNHNIIYKKMYNYII